MRLSIFFFILVNVVGDLSFAQSCAYTNDSIPLKGRNIVLYPTKDVKFDTYARSSSCYANIYTKDGKYAFDFSDYQFYTTYGEFNEYRILKGKGFKESYLYTKLKPEIRNNVVDYEKYDSPIDMSERIKYVTPTGQVMIFKWYQKTGLKLKHKEGSDAFAKWLNTMKIIPYTPEPNGLNSSYVKLEGMPSFSEMHYAVNDKYAVLTYGSEAGELLVEIINQDSKEKKVLNLTSKYYALLDCAIYDDKIGIIAMNNLSPEGDKEEYIPRKSVDLVLYNVGGEYLGKMPLTNELYIKNTWDIAYYRNMGDPSVTLTDDQIIVAIPVNMKWDDGLTHQGEKDFIYNYSGDTIYHHRWSVSHSFQQYTASYGDTSYYVSLGDAYPRGINILALNGDDWLYEIVISPFKGKKGENYVYDTDIAEAFQMGSKFVVLYSSEQYDGLKSSKLQYYFLSGVGKNQIYMNVSTPEENEDIHLFPDLEKDMYITAACPLNDSLLIASIFSLQKDPNCAIDYERKKDGFRSLDYFENDLDSLFEIEEFITVLNLKGEEVIEPIPLMNTGNYYWQDEFRDLHKRGIKGKFFKSGEKVVFVRQLYATNHLEMIEFSLDELIRN